MSVVTVVPTGTANIASVRAAFRRLGASPQDAATPGDVIDADRVVLPGVGSFGAAMSAVDASAMREALRERIDSGRPTLAVCVGMQLLGSASAESPGARGLGVIPATVERFDDSVRVPQLGWNRVAPNPGSRFIEPGWAYFANSYRLVTPPEGWLCATTDYGGRFVSAVERGPVLALQFHPELSGPWGAGVIRRWLTQAGESS